MNDLESSGARTDVMDYHLALRERWHGLHRPNARPHGPVAVLIAWQIVALAGQVGAVALARHGNRTIGEVLSDVSLALAYGSALWTLTATHLIRAARNAAVLCLGLTPTLYWRATNPLLFTGFDEQLHMRTLGDIISSHQLFQANPLLEVSPRYPGLEAVTVLVHQLGVPTMASAFLVILACRVVLVTVLCNAVETMTGSERAAGLSVAVYALSSQFVFFNSQFAYQTMAIPLALSAVSLLARARFASDPMPLAGGASVCLAAVAVTHHVTSFLTAMLLLVWTVLELPGRRIWVAYGACAAMASTLAWAIVQRQLLSDYFGPIVDDVRAQFIGGDRRELFKDSAGVASRSLDQYLLLYYAAALSLIVLVVLVLAYRESHHKTPPLLMLAALSAMVPTLLAARVLPKGGELYDRSNSFLFFPFSFYVASLAAWFLWRIPGHAGFREDRRATVIRLICVALASGAFLGGYVLGSGPSWARLPGSYMVAADPRSMDPESLAAARWARDALPAGSRITAERVSSTLLASQAGLWPVMQGPGYVDAPALYVARNWGLTETDMAGAMQIRYIYADRRWAEALPPYGNYFFSGETGEGAQLTDQQLTKFDKVPGISLVYRHGPVSIYDLKGLGFAELRSGWFGTTPQVRVTTQLAVGLTVGLFLCLVVRSRLWPGIRRDIARLPQAAGMALAWAAVLAGLCLASILLLLAGVWLTPLTIWSAVAVVVLVNRAAVVARVRSWLPPLSRPTLRIAVLASMSFAIVAAASIVDAAGQDVVKVHQILDDPAAIHVPENGGAG